MAAPRKDNIKEKILQATTELLKTTALADISLAEIAAAAGISKGTLYYHYKTKNEVFLDITQRFLDEQWEDLIRWTDNKEKDTSLNRLVRYVAERDIASAGLRLQLLQDAGCRHRRNRRGGTRLIRLRHPLPAAGRRPTTAVPARRTRAPAAA